MIIDVHAIYFVVKNSLFLADLLMLWFVFYVKACFCQLHKFFYSQGLVQCLSKLLLQVWLATCLKFGTFLSFMPSWESPCGFAALIVVHHKNQEKSFLISEK